MILGCLFGAHPIAAKQIYQPLPLLSKLKGYIYLYRLLIIRPSLSNLSEKKISICLGSTFSPDWLKWHLNAFLLPLYEKPYEDCPFIRQKRHFFSVSRLCLIYIIHLWCIFQLYGCFWYSLFLDQFKYPPCVQAYMGRVPLALLQFLLSSKECQQGWFYV